MYQTTSLGRPDWETTDTDEDVETSNLSNLNLTMSAGDDDDDDVAVVPIVKTDDDEVVVLEEVPAAEEEKRAEDEELDELKALDRLATELKEDEMTLNNLENEEE